MSCFGKLMIAIVFVVGPVGCAVNNGPEDNATPDDPSGTTENVSSASSELSDPGPTPQLGSTWCCRAMTVFNNSWSCHQYKTLGVVAAAKCAAFFAGVPIVDGIRLDKTACSNIPECM